MSNAVVNTARLLYRLLWSSLLVEISTLAYESNSIFGEQGCQWRTVTI
jgi:hypothetical protein